MIDQRPKKRRRYSTRPESASHELYVTWCGIKQRCLNPDSESYVNYGGRGVQMCEKWMNDFWAFVQDVGPKQAGKSLDRIDNNGHYEPGNIRWATPTEQILNRRPGKLKLIQFGGKTQTASAWERELGFPSCTVSSRLAYGWTVEEALSTPVRRRGQKNLHRHGWRSSPAGLAEGNV